MPNYQKNGFSHFEEIQLFVDGISKDRISDIACNFLKSFLIDFTIDQCEKLGIPLRDCSVDIYDYRANGFAMSKIVKLPINPQNGKPIILVPKRWLRYTPGSPTTTISRISARKTILPMRARLWSE